MDAATLYPASSIKRKRRTKAELDSLKQSMLDIIAENYPMTVRQLFYQMGYLGFFL